MRGRRADSFQGWRRFGSLLAMILAASISGPRAVAAGSFHSEEGHFGFSAGPSWVELPRAAVDQEIERMRAQAPVQAAEIDYDFAFQHASAPGHFEFPFFFVISRREVVHSRTPEQSLRKIQSRFQGSLQKQAGKDLANQPNFLSSHYNRERQVITYAVRIGLPRPEGPLPVINTNAVFFGSGRVVTFKLYATPDSLQQVIPDFEGVLNSFRFDPGYEELPSFWRRLFILAFAIVGLLLVVVLVNARRRRRSTQRGTPA